MKSLFVTILALIAGFDAVKAWGSCRNEIVQYTSNNRVCAERGMTIQSFLLKLSKGDITYDELAEKIARECERANSGSCYNDISIPIDGSCNDAESVQHFRNALKTVIYFNKFLCQNDGQKYLDFAKNGGAACYYNDEKARCYNEHKDATNIGKLSFTNANVCHVLNSDWKCLHHLNDCENKNVYDYYHQILSSLRETFSC